MILDEINFEEILTFFKKKISYSIKKITRFQLI